MRQEHCKNRKGKRATFVARHHLNKKILTRPHNPRVIMTQDSFKLADMIAGVNLAILNKLNFALSMKKGGMK